MAEHRPISARLLGCPLLFGFLLMLAGSGSVAQAASWFDSDWQYRQLITISPSVTNSDLTDFPYMLKITDITNPLFDNAQIDGDDIVLTADDGISTLDHEIEYYDSVAETLVAWVRIPTLSSTVSTDIYMYYGNGSVSTQENVPGVWSNGYEAVYHLHDDFNDSKGSHNGTNSGSADVTGQIADGQDFYPDDGVDEISIGNWNFTGDSLTISAWMKSDDGFAQDDPRIISKANSGTPEDHVYMLSLYDGTINENRLRFRVKTGLSDTLGMTELQGSSPNGYLPDAAEWYLVAGTYDGTQMRLIRDGLDAGSTAKTGLIRQNAWPSYIGNNTANTDTALYSFDGKLDEVRIASAARSLDWMGANYLSQSSPASYVTLGAPDTSYTVGGRVFEDADFTGTASDYDGGTGDSVSSNVDVELYDASDSTFISSTVTDVSGNYNFGGLLNGDYIVRVRSVTMGDSDTKPAGGLNGTVPGTWPYPHPEMTWGNGAAVYGGQSATADDADTGDNAGIGDTHLPVAVSSGDVTGVNFGFAYNLIVNTEDDGLADNTRSDQGSFRQFLKNANAIGSASGTTANSSEFRMQVPAVVVDGPDSWWRFTATAVNPPISDGGTTVDGSTQRANSGADSNTRGPEIELFGNGISAVGLTLSGANEVVRELAINGFGGTGVLVTSNGGSTIAGCYIGTNAIGTLVSANDGYGIEIRTSGNTIGGTLAGDRNIVSGSGIDGIYLNGATATGNQILGNYIGVNAAGDGDFGNGQHGIVVEGPDNQIGGVAAGARNVISGNTRSAIFLTGTSAMNNVIRGNYLGTDESGVSSIANDWDGVTIRAGATQDTIGGTTTESRNIIAGNTEDGIYIGDEASDGHVIEGNWIGVNALGNPLANGWHGITVDLGADACRIGGSVTGAGNVIASNGMDGVRIMTGSLGNSILGNSIYSNSELGIDLNNDDVTLNDDDDPDTGPNNFQNFPVLTSVVTTGSGSILIEGTLNSVASADYRVEFFSNATADVSGYGEGETYLGADTVTTDGLGDVSFSVTLSATVGAGAYITATATDPSGNASEFSATTTAVLYVPVITKKAYFSDDSAVPDGAILPAGTEIRYLLYVNNRLTARNDVVLQDVLDPTFAYVGGTILYDNSVATCAGGTCTTSEESTILAAALAGTVGTDGVDGDVVSYTGSTLDIGDAIVANNQLDILAEKIWAVVFTVKIN